MMGMKKVIFLTHSAGFRHDYLPVAAEVLKELGRRTGYFEIVCTEDCSVITRENLRDVDALIFATSGELPMDDDQKKALIDFVKGGKGFMGIHNATDTFYKFPEYGRMIGGYFNGHPWTGEVYVIVEDREHPATRHLPERFKVKEEVYAFKQWSRDRTHVLISLDNSSVDLSKGNRPDNDYALCWCHNYGRGRVFYTAFGHFKELWYEEWFQKHLLGGLMWVAKVID